jgi:hypothetical protein
VLTREQNVEDWARTPSARPCSTRPTRSRPRSHVRPSRSRRTSP